MMEVTDKILLLAQDVYDRAMLEARPLMSRTIPMKAALEAVLAMVDDKESGSAAELNATVDMILKATDLKRLQETTLMNFPEKKQSADNAQHECSGRTDGYGGFACVTCGKHNPKLSAEEDNQGWIEWKGGYPPVHGDVMVEVKTKSNEQSTRRAGSFIWTNDGFSDRIVAYRIIKEEPGEIIEVNNLIDKQCVKCGEKVGKPKEKVPTLFEYVNNSPIGRPWTHESRILLQVIGGYLDKYMTRKE